MKNSKVFALGLFALVAAIFLVAGVYAGGDDSPLLRAIPQQSVWVADGVTQYSIMVSADSNPMNGQGTRGIQFDYILPQIAGYTFNFVSVDMAPANDFFAGYNTINNQGGSLIARSLSSAGNGPANRVGNVVELRFTVTQDITYRAEAVQTNLQFDQSVNENNQPIYTYFLRPSSQGGRIAPVIESVPFTVQPRFQSVAAHAASFVCTPEDC